MALDSGTAKEQVAPIHGVVSKLNARIDVLDEQVTKLASRLEPILSPVPYIETSGCISEQPNESKIVKELKGFVEKIEQISRKVEYLLAKLEV